MSPLDRALAEAVSLAAANVAEGQLPFGAVVVLDGEIVGRGVNTTLRDLDPTAHAEVAAVRDACRKLSTLDLAGSIVATSCAPCPMCRDTAVCAGVERIVYAASVDLATEYGLGIEGRWQRIHRLWDASEPDFTVAGAAAAPERPFALWQERQATQ